MSESVEQFRACLERYEQAMGRVEAGLRPGDGLFGFGNDPKRSPYHMDFYNRWGRWPAGWREESGPRRRRGRRWSFC